MIAAGRPSHRRCRCNRSEGVALKANCFIRGNGKNQTLQHTNFDMTDDDVANVDIAERAAWKHKIRNVLSVDVALGCTAVRADFSTCFSVVMVGVPRRLTLWAILDEARPDIPQPRGSVLLFQPFVI